MDREVVIIRRKLAVLETNWRTLGDITGSRQGEILTRVRKLVEGEAHKKEVDRLHKKLQDAEARIREDLVVKRGMLDRITAMEAQVRQKEQIGTLVTRYLEGLDAAMGTPAVQALGHHLVQEYLKDCQGEPEASMVIQICEDYGETYQAMLEDVKEAVGKLQDLRELFPVQRVGGMPPRREMPEDKMESPPRVTVEVFEDMLEGDQGQVTADPVRETGTPEELRVTVATQPSGAGAPDHVMQDLDAIVGQFDVSGSV
jgi:hypothetical protein